MAPEQPRIGFILGIAVGAWLGITGTIVYITLIAWILASLEWPAPQWLGWAVLYAIAALAFVPSLLVARRHRTWFVGGCLGLGAGLLVTLTIVLVLVLSYRASHPPGFFID